MVGTFWAFVPAIIAIVLALATKQVYLSLFAGIFTGAMFLAGGNPIEAISNLFITMGNQLGGNGGILIFLVILGIFAVFMVAARRTVSGRPPRSRPRRARSSRRSVSARSSSWTTTLTA